MNLADYWLRIDGKREADYPASMYGNGVLCNQDVREES
jgi:hypothetical protein